MWETTQKLEALLRKPRSNTKPGESSATASPVDQKRDSELEKLPAEIRRQILSTSDLHGLRALVHASPIFHYQYLLDRKFLLAASIDVTLGTGSIDAHAVQELEVIDNGSNTADHVTRVLETWRINVRQRRSWRLNLADAFTEDEAVLMASYHLRTVVPVAQQFASAASDGRAAHMINLKDHELSSTEWQRFFRATYRFQLLCRVACSNSSGDASVNAVFLIDSLEAWEAEELCSFCEYAEGVYDKIFDRISVDVHPENPRFDNQTRPPTPDGAFEFHNSWTRQRFAEGTALRGGLNLLGTVLFDVGLNDQERLVSLMQRSIVTSYIPISSEIEGIFSDMHQARRRDLEPSLGDRMTEKRVPCPFGGDNLNAPPLGWTVIWGGTYSNRYGGYIDEELRQWAYVFWDGDTLRKYGGEDSLDLYWACCRDSDPRDMM